MSGSYTPVDTMLCWILKMTHYVFCISLNRWEITQIVCALMYQIMFFGYKLKIAVCLLTICLCSCLLCLSSTGDAESVTGIPFFFCYLLFIWKCLLLSVSVDWLSIVVCSSVHIYVNGYLCWNFLFGKDETAPHSKCLSTVFIFNS